MHNPNKRGKSNECIPNTCNSFLYQEIQKNYTNAWMNEWMKW